MQFNNLFLRDVRTARCKTLSYINMKKVHFLILGFLTIGLIFTHWLSLLQTPFSGSDYSVPYETDELKSVLGKDEYKLIGPFGHEAISQEDRYIQPITTYGKYLAIVFKYRVQLAFAFALSGIFFIIASRKYLKYENIFYKKAVHLLFIITAFYVTMCTRWWGFG